MTARNIVKLGHSSIVKLLSKSNSDRVAAINYMLDSQMGKAVVSAVMGAVLTVTPQFKDDIRVQTLAEELRVNGLAAAGNTAVDEIQELFGPALNQLFTSAMSVEQVLPSTAAPAAVSRTHLKSAPQEEYEEDEEAEETTTANRAHVS